MTQFNSNGSLLNTEPTRYQLGWNSSGSEPLQGSSSSVFYTDKFGIMREAHCFREESSNFELIEPFSGYFPAALITTERTDSFVSESAKLEIDVKPLTSSYCRQKVYASQQNYTEGSAPLCGGDSLLDHESFLEHTLPRPSSCGTRSARDNNSASTFVPRAPCTTPNSLKKSCECTRSTPPLSPLFIHIHNSCAFGNSQLGNVQEQRQFESFDVSKSLQDIHRAKETYLSSGLKFQQGSGIHYAPYVPSPVPSPIPTTSRQDNDELLVRLRDQGISYKEIKKRLNCPEAESTLRGRHRTLTKPKDARVRKPKWTQRDIEILVNCVTRLILSPQNAPSAEDKLSRGKIQ
ncbi:hypothetical protein BDZ91DRAFT_716737, partial [Kalaharituber pfeilii]